MTPARLLDIAVAVTCLALAVVSALHDWNGETWMRCGITAVFAGIGVHLLLEDPKR
jgi:hypothetical protein